MGMEDIREYSEKLLLLACDYSLTTFCFSTRLSKTLRHSLLLHEKSVLLQLQNVTIKLFSSAAVVDSSAHVTNFILFLNASLRNNLMWQ